MHLATSILDGIEVLSDLPADAEAMPSAVRSALHERAAAELPNLVTRLSALYDMEKVGELWMMGPMGRVMQDLAAKGITFE